jgi:Protein of unknown function (DUF664)
MTADPKKTLHRYLRAGGDAMLWKLEGLGEYDIRRPMTPTGTSLLGMIKHLAGCEAGYFGETFGRPFPEPMPWDGEAGDDPNVDMFATASESREDITGLYQRARAHADATIDALGLDAPGQVPWWGERGAVTLHEILVHMLAETQRHAGHADIIREMIDGQVGLTPGNGNLPDGDQAFWESYAARVEDAARAAARA